MRYVTRPGIVREMICGTNILIPTRAASEYCKSILPLPILLAAAWDALSNGKSFEYNVTAHSKILHISQEQAEANLRQFCEDLCKKGFMMKIEYSDGKGEMEQSDENKD